MAITLNASLATTTASTSFTVAGSNSLLVVAWYDFSDTTETVNWNGAGATNETTRKVGGGGEVTHLWYLQNPGAATGNIVISVAPSQGFIANFNGVKNAAAVDTGGAANSSSSTQSDTRNVNSGGLMVAINVNDGSAAMTVDANSQNVLAQVGAAILIGSKPYTIAAGGTYTLKTTTVASQNWVMSDASFDGAVAVAVTTIPQFMSMGIGGL